MTISFQGSGKRIDDYDIPRIGALIGCSEDEIHAVLDVESAGSGFDRAGRLKTLYEPHVFYRCLPQEKRAEAVNAGLAYSAWRPGEYPPDSYPRLMRAIQMDETAALKACSWGLGQILGENHKAAGYDTPQDMVADFCADEANQLEAMIRFIKSKGLDRALRQHDWSTFARGYNGANYAKHGYHVKLESAFNKWSQIKDVAYDPKAAPPVAPKPVQKPKSNAPEATVGTVIVAGGAAASKAAGDTWGGWGFVGGAVVTVVLAVAIIAIIHKRRG